MKILILTDSFNYCCGRSKHIYLLAKYLQKAGHFVYVVYGGGDGYPLLKRDEIPSMEMKYLLHSNRSYKNFIKSIYQLYYLQKINKFDIIHAHHHYASAAVRIVTKITKIPQVVTIHSFASRKGILPFYIGDYFIAVSEQIRRFVFSESKKLSESNVCLIYSGIETKIDSIDILEVKRNIGIDYNDIVISIIGRVTNDKGHANLLRALSEINNNLNITCLVVGDGEYLNYIKDLARNLKLKVVFTGNQKNTSQFFTISDLHIIPSIGGEGLPFSLLEAGVHSKPVVASNTGGILDMIINYKNGILVEKDNIKELAKAISFCLLNEDKCKQMGLELRGKIVERHSLDQMIDKTVSVYKRLISSR